MGDEDLASATMKRIQSMQSNSDAEETIKMLLEHIEKPENQNLSEKLANAMIRIEDLEFNMVVKEQDYEERLDTSEKKAAAFEDLITHRNQTISNLKSKLLNSNAELNQKEEQIQRLNVTVVEMSVKNNDIKAEKDAIVKTLDELKMVTNSNETKLKEMLERLNALKENQNNLNESNTNIIDNLNAEISSIDIQLKKKDEEIDNLNCKLREITNKCDEMKIEKENISKSLEEKQRENDLLCEGNENALKCIEELEKEMKTNEIELNEMITNSSKFKNFIELKNKNEQIQELNEKLKELTVERDAIKSERNNIAKSLDNAERENDNLRDSKANALKRNAELEMEIRSNAIKLNEMTKHSNESGKSKARNELILKSFIYSRLVPKITNGNSSLKAQQKEMQELNRKLQAILKYDVTKNKNLENSGTVKTEEPKNTSQLDLDVKEIALKHIDEFMQTISNNDNIVKNMHELIKQLPIFMKNSVKEIPQINRIGQPVIYRPYFRPDGTSISMQIGPSYPSYSPHPQYFMSPPTLIHNTSIPTKSPFQQKESIGISYKHN